MELKIKLAIFAGVSLQFAILYYKVTGDKMPQDVAEYGTALLI
jgi:hypothetical protein